MVMKTKVLASRDPGWSLFPLEKEVQRLCNEHANDSALLGCGLMFGESHVIGGARQNAYTDGIVGQVTFSFWVPKEWAGRVDTRCNELAVELEQHSSFPGDLKGHYKNATDAPFVKGLELDLFKKELPSNSDIDLEFLDIYYKTFTKSFRHAAACQKEKARRDGLKGG